MLLFIDACVRRESRTRRLAERYLAGVGGEVKRLRLEETEFPRVDEAFLRWRDGCIARGDYASARFDPARDFAAADEIVIAAPYWDLSFPASLKQFFEQICVLGLTFRYTPEDVPEGLCRARRLTYVTTAGGPIYSTAPGFGYVEALARTFYGIPEVRLNSAENLDIAGANVEGLLRAAEADIDRLLKSQDKEET